MKLLVVGIVLVGFILLTYLYLNIPHDGLEQSVDQGYHIKIPAQPKQKAEENQKNQANVIIREQPKTNRVDDIAKRIRSVISDGDRKVEQTGEFDFYAFATDFSRLGGEMLSASELVNLAKQMPTATKNESYVASYQDTVANRFAAIAQPSDLSGALEQAWTTSDQDTRSKILRLIERVSGQRFHPVVYEWFSRLDGTSEEKVKFFGYTIGYMAGQLAQPSDVKTIFEKLQMFGVEGDSVASTASIQAVEGLLDGRLATSVGEVVSDSSFTEEIRLLALKKLSDLPSEDSRNLLMNWANSPDDKIAEAAAIGLQQLWARFPGLRP
jgi:hypothetical protein